MQRNSQDVTDSLEGIQEVLVQIPLPVDRILGPKRYKGLGPGTTSGRHMQQISVSCPLRTQVSGKLVIGCHRHHHSLGMGKTSFRLHTLSLLTGKLDVREFPSKQRPRVSKRLVLSIAEQALPPECLWSYVSIAQGGLPHAAPACRYELDLSQRPLVVLVVPLTMEER